MKSNEFTCPRCGQLIRIITVDDKGKEITSLNPIIFYRLPQKATKTRKGE